jgi:hypothetical protein
MMRASWSTRGNSHNEGERERERVVMEEGRRWARKAMVLTLRYFSPRKIRKRSGWKGGGVVQLHCSCKGVNANDRGGITRLKKGIFRLSNI